MDWGVGVGSMELGLECRYMFILSIVLYPDVATTFPRGQFHISVSAAARHAFVSGIKRCGYI